MSFVRSVEKLEDWKGILSTVLVSAEYFQKSVACDFDNTPPNKSMQRKFDPVFRAGDASAQPASISAHFRR